MQDLPKQEAGKNDDRERGGESGDDPCWAREHGYYYDDAHGYEPYDPDADEEDDEPEVEDEGPLSGRE